MIKYFIFIAILLFTLIILIGCSQEEAAPLSYKQVKPVSILTLKVESINVAFGYHGRVSASEMINSTLIIEDISKISLGTKVDIKLNNQEGLGEVAKIAAIPDLLKGTFAVDIKIITGDFPAASIVDVTFINEQLEGILIPINSVIVEDNDYVFVVENGHVLKKPITISEIIGFRVLVSGLAPGDSLVIAGLKHLNENDQVTIKN